MQYKLAELRRAYSVIGEKLQRSTDAVSRYWYTVSDTWSSFSHHLTDFCQSAKMKLMGAYNQ